MKELLKITSLTNSHIKELALLANSKERNAKKKVLLEGEHLVKEAYGLGVLEEVLIVDENDYLDGVNNILVTKDIIKKLSTTATPQSIIGIAKIVDKEIEFGNTILLLDGISDPGNLGTIVRTAKAFDVSSIILSSRSIDIYNEKVIRATQGAIFKMPIIKMNMLDAISLLKDKGYLVLATALKDASYLDSIDKVDKYALVLGNEATGVSKEVIEASDKVVKIKMSENVESLNVAIACGICLYDLNNKRK